MNRIINIICLAVGLLIGANSSNFFKHDQPQKPVAATEAQSPDAIKSRSIEVEAHYQGQMDSLEHTNDALINQVTKAKSELREAKQDNKTLHDLVDTLIADAGKTTDTAQKLIACDSLQSTVVDLMASSSKKDSLYEQLTGTLQAQIAGKDSSLIVRQQAYNALKLSFDNSLAQQDLLSTQNHQFEKQLNQMKVKNKLLSTGLLIVSGIAVYGILKH